MAKYLKVDSELGYIDNPAEIAYTKFNNLRHALLGFMMGDFDQYGRYVIANDVVRELIAMKKHIIEVDDNIEICHGEIRLDKPFTFVITYEGNRVTLSLLEKLNYEANYKLDSGAYSNINEYVLDEIETSGIIDRNLVYKQWNVDTFGGMELDIFSCEDSILEKYFGITKRFKYLIKANSILIEKEDEIEEIEAEYANRILDLLVAYPKLRKAVEEELSKGLINKTDFICADKLFFAKTINEVLDNAIDSNISLLNEEERSAFTESKRLITRDINIKREEVLNIETVKVEGSTHSKDNEEESQVIRIDTNHEENIESLHSLAKSYADTVVAKQADQVKQLEKSQQKVEKTETEKLIETVTALVGAEHVYSTGYQEQHKKQETAGTKTPDANEKEKKEEKKNNLVTGTAARASGTKSDGKSGSDGKGKSDGKKKTEKQTPDKTNDKGQGGQKGDNNRENKEEKKESLLILGVLSNKKELTPEERAQQEKEQRLEESRKLARRYAEEEARRLKVTRGQNDALDSWLSGVHRETEKAEGYAEKEIDDKNEREEDLLKK